MTFLYLWMFWMNNKYIGEGFFIKEHFLIWLEFAEALVLGFFFWWKIKRWKSFFEKNTFPSFRDLGSFTYIKSVCVRREQISFNKTLLLTRLINNYFLKDSCVHNSNYRCFSCLTKFGRSGEHLSQEGSVKILTPSDNQIGVRKRPALHLWQPSRFSSVQTGSKKLCLFENRCVFINMNLKIFSFFLQ